MIPKAKNISWVVYLYKYVYKNIHCKLDALAVNDIFSGFTGVENTTFIHSQAKKKTTEMNVNVCKNFMKKYIKDNKK